jgi:hypothetical protein
MWLKVYTEDHIAMFTGVPQDLESDQNESMRRRCRRPKEQMQNAAASAN